MTSATHETAIRERLFEALQAHMRRIIDVWTASDEGAEDRFVASVVELVDVCETTLSTPLTATRIERTAELFWAYFVELACRADFAPEGPARPSCRDALAFELAALGDVAQTVDAAERMRDGPWVANELRLCASACSVAASALRRLATQRRRQERSISLRRRRFDA